MAAAIETVNFAEKASTIIPAKAVFGFVGTLTVIRVFSLLFSDDLLQVHAYLADPITNELNFLKLGLFALMSAEGLADARMETNRTSSVRPRMMQ